MRRTNIYLEAHQDTLLRRLSRQRDEPVAVIVRAAIDEWLERHGAELLDDEEWERRFASLLDRRSAVVADDLDEQQIAADVAAAIAEVRAERRRARSR